EARNRLQSLYHYSSSPKGRVNPTKPSQNPARNIAFFRDSTKSGTMERAEWEHLKVYVEAVLRNGTPFDTCGIRLSDDQFLWPDKARVGTAINDGVLEAVTGSDRILRFTSNGFMRYSREVGI